MADERNAEPGGTAHTSFTLERESLMSRTHHLSRDGVAVGTLRLDGWSRGATAAVGGETWTFETTGFFRQRTTVASQTGTVLAQMRGKDAEVVGAPPLRWGTLRFASLWGFTRPDGSVAAQFSRLKGFTGRTMEIATMNGDARVDLVCALLGGLFLIRQSQAAAATANAGG